MSLTLFAVNHTLIFIIGLLSLSFALMFWDKVIIISQLVMLLVFFAMGGAAQYTLVLLLGIVQILLAAFSIYRFSKKLNRDAQRALNRTFHKLLR